MEIRETQTGLYTTITKVHTVTNRVNVFWTYEDAIRSLSKWQRVKLRVNKIKAMRRASSFKVFAKIVSISFILLILLSVMTSCVSSRGCTTRAGNYNTVRY